MTHRTMLGIALAAAAMLSGCQDTKGLEDRFVELQRQINDNGAAIRKLEAKLAVVVNDQNAAMKRLEFEITQQAGERGGAQAPAGEGALDQKAAVERTGMRGAVKAGAGDETQEKIGGEFPSDVADKFLKVCNARSGGRGDFCECMLARIQETFSVEVFARLAPKWATESRPEELADLITVCGGGKGGKNKDKAGGKGGEQGDKGGKGGKKGR